MKRVTSIIGAISGNPYRLMKIATVALSVVCTLLTDGFAAEAGKNAKISAGAPARMEWTVEGVTREALVYVPPTATTKPTPVVFSFHGHYGTMKHAASGKAYHRLWPEAIAVYMQGLNTPGRLVDPEGKKPGWQAFAGDQKDRDLKFFDAVLTTLKKNYRVDNKRIYCTGHSNGGGFTYLLWSERGDVFAAMAPSASAAMSFGLPGKVPQKFAALAAKVAGDAKPLKPKPVMHIAGNKDSLVKFAWQKRTIDSLLKLNGSGEGQPWKNHEYCTIYPSKTGTPVITYIFPGGHSFPPDAQTLIVKFFKEQVKP